MKTQPNRRRVLGGATHLIVVDLEATCSDDGTVPRDQMEIIEIGAVLVGMEDLEVLDTFQTLVLPVRHQELTPFCTELTGITQNMVEDDGVPFADAMAALKQWMRLGERHAVFGSWGDYDRKQFDQDCRFHRITYPMPHHINLKKRFSIKQGLRKRLGMAGALKKCGLPLEGNHHRALDDAKNISKLLPWIVGGAKL